MTPILAIDPGASGGLALSDHDGFAFALPMPEGMTAQVDAIRTLAVGNPCLVAFIENVGFHMPGNSAVSTAKFARHVGHLEAALYSCGISFVAVAPAKWMSALGAMPKDKTARKNAIKEAVQRRFPEIRVNLKTADALGILIWAKGLK